MRILSALFVLLGFGISANAFAEDLQTQIDQIKKQLAAQPSHSDTSVGGYGEIKFNHFSKEPSRSQLDMSRFVITLGHQFSDQLSFTGEVEWEHAVASKSDGGETEIEQSYLNYRFSPRLSMKGGLFLIPLGLLNESHEPPVFYGAERNEVETRIVPTTWREGGLSLGGDLDCGLSWQTGVTTGFNLAKFDDASKPLASVHQELQNAKTQDMSYFAALNYRGLPGLTAGSALFTGKSTQGNAEFKADPARLDLGGAGGLITLYDVHVRWQWKGWDAQAVYAHGSIGDADKIDSKIAAFNLAHPPADARPFVPSGFFGWYGQVAYTAWEHGQMSLSPFARYEEFNTQAKMPTGFTADSATADRVWTLGLSFKPHPDVVLKSDYQKFADNKLNDRFNVGLGYMF